MRIIRMKELIHIVGMAETQIRTAIAADSFPRPIKLSDAGRSVGWDEAEVNEWRRKRLERHRVDISAVVRGKKVTSGKTKAKKKVRV